jgi:hypothetical protein
VDDLKAMFEMVQSGNDLRGLLNEAIMEIEKGKLKSDSSSIDSDQTGTVGTDRRHRFVDPLFRRRRLKWMERFLAGMNNSKEIKYNRHFTRHPDEQKTWPTNMGSVTVKWPNRRN